MKSLYKRVKNKELYVIAENLSNLYKCGIPFLDIFELLVELPLSKEYIVSLSNINEEISKGKSLYNGFNKFPHLYPEFYISMIKIGEKTGRLSEVLMALAIYYKKIESVNQLLISSITYPLTLLGSMIVLFVFLFTTIVPSFVDIYLSMGKDIPFVYSIVIKINDYAKAMPLAFICTIFSWFILIPFFIYRYWLKNIIYKKISTIRFIKDIREYISIFIFSIILKSGINLTSGLMICSEIDMNYGLKNNFRYIEKKVTMGTTLTEALKDCGIFSKFTVANVRLGEESGNLESQLNNIESILFKNLSTSIDKKLALIGPVLIIFIGILIVSFILIFVLPLFNNLI